MDLLKTEAIDCPLCGNSNNKQKHRLRPWKIVQCTNCEFVYTNPRLQKSELIKIYSANYFDNKEFGYYHYTENRELRKKNFSKWVTDALPYFKQHTALKALDVGCAAGYCLEEFAANNWQAYGIELDKNLADDLRQKNFKIFDTPLIQLTTNEKFNLVTLFDVLEHLTDLKQNMTKLHELLQDDGALVIVTPDYGSWQRKLFGKRWFQFKPVEHINYFSLATLKKLATDNGFEVISDKASGQFCDTLFLENRLKKYNFRFLLPSFHLLLKILRLKGKNFYVDTASRYVILKKKSGLSAATTPHQPSP